MSDREHPPPKLFRPSRDVALVALREVAVTLRSGLSPLARLRPLPSPARPPAAEARPPVLMVHGYMASADVLRPLARRLLTEGWHDVRLIAYPSLTATMEQILERIALDVITAAREHGGKVDLVGHSLGAVACRVWLKLYGGDAHVRRFVSLGGPHAGTSLYRLVPSPVREVFDPRGPWVSLIGEGPEPVPTTVIRARYDHQVFPPTRACIPGADEHIVEAHGHNGLLWSSQAHQAVIDALRAPDAPPA